MFEQINPAIVKATLDGFFLGLGFIFSIGPQNLHLIRQGINREYEWTTAVTGYTSEFVLIALGLTGFAAVASGPGELAAFRWLGIAFLLICGIRTLRSAQSRASGGQTSRRMTNRRQAISVMMVMTWLNPLVYVEIMMLGGGLAASYSGLGSASFAAGFLLASAVRFFGLSLAGRPLTALISQGSAVRVFERVSGFLLIGVAGSVALSTPRWWPCDAMVAAVMLWTAYQLIASALRDLLDRMLHDPQQAAIRAASGRRPARRRRLEGPPDHPLVAALNRCHGPSSAGALQAPAAAPPLALPLAWR